MPIWVVFGERDDVGLADTERDVLLRCPTTSLVTIPGCGHMIPDQEPGRVADLVVAALAAAG